MADWPLPVYLGFVAGTAGVMTYAMFKLLQWGGIL
jgi:hypothetical protein